jgi:lipoic acid synthetase
MIMGDTCTRGCRFCAVKSGHPGGILDSNEPENTAKAIASWGLDYVVITSVDRDDLPDGGANHFAQTIRAVKREAPRTLVEVLVPDFREDLEAVETVVKAEPHVFGHNIETIERLTPKVRDPRATYEQSLTVLEAAKSMNQGMYTKSSIMLGLGESEDEVIEAMKDLRMVHVDFLTIGQYLRPTRRHLEIQEYVPPERFDKLRQVAESLGFLYVASGPLVRSSYRAGEYYLKSIVEKKLRAYNPA